MEQTMNMISTGSFLTETSASNKQNELVKKLTSAWEKKNSKAARAGGVSLMALSLAACGSEDDQIAALEADVLTAQAATAAVQADLDTANASVASLTTDLAAANASVTSLTADLATATADKATLTTEKAAIQADLDAANESVASLTEQLATATASVTTLTADLATANATVETLTADLATANAATSTAETALSALQTTYDALVASNSTLQAAYDALANPPAVSTTLTANQDIASTTSNNDTITGTQATYTATDVISDSSSTDSDTLTVTTTTDISATPTVNGIETVTFNASGFTAAGVNNIAGADPLGVARDGTDFEVDVANITGGTVTFNATQLGTTIDAIVLSNVGSITAVAGTNIATVNAQQVDGASAVFNTGEATAAIIDASGTIADQTISVVANDDLDLTVTDAETLNITAATDAVITLNDNSTDLDGGDGTIAVTGTNVSLIAHADDIDGTTITGTSEVSILTTEITDSAFDARDIAGVINLEDGAVVGDTITIASGATVQFAGADDAVTLDINDGTSTDVDTGVANVIFEVASTGASAITINATDDTISTLNVSTATSTAGVNADQDDLTINATTALAVTLSGAGDIVLDSSGFATTAGSTLNASAMTGDLTVTADAQLLTITGGSGTDDITALSAAAFVLDGGDGNDTLNTAANMTLGSFTGFEILDIADDDSFTASQLSGYTAVIETIGGSINVSSADAIDIATIDMSGLTFQTATDDIDIDFGDIDEAVLLATTGVTYTGANAVDTVTGSDNADTISGNAGADIIAGGDGNDIISGGDGNDSLTGGDDDDTLTGGDGDDTFFFSVIGSNGSDTITDFTVADDDLDLDDVFVISGEEAVAAESAVASTADLELYVFADASQDITGTAGSGIADFTDLADVANFLDTAITAADGHEYLAILNNAAGTTAYVFYVEEAAENDADNDITSGDLSLLATITTDSAITTDVTIIA
jgi:Ca2+-binding RTX toxin-like protein